MKPSPRLFALLLAAALPLFWAAPSLAGHMSESTHSAPLAVGQFFPDVVLDGAAEPRALDLGIGASNTPFKLDKLKTPVLVVEIFSMYCPYCQAEAPVTLELVDLIKERGLAGQIKLFGVGAGNTQYEVDVFREKYGIPFPLFPDPDYSIHKACGEVGTPFFYVLAREREGYKVRLVQEGQMPGAKRFLGAILKATDLQ